MWTRKTFDGFSITEQKLYTPEDHVAFLSTLQHLENHFEIPAPQRLLKKRLKSVVLHDCAIVYTKFC